MRLAATGDERKDMRITLVLVAEVADCPKSDAENPGGNKLSVFLTAII